MSIAQLRGGSIGYLLQTIPERHVLFRRGSPGHTRRQVGVIDDFDQFDIRRGEVLTGEPNKGVKVWPADGILTRGPRSLPAPDARPRCPQVCDFDGERRRFKFRLNLSHDVCAPLADCALQPAFQAFLSAPPFLVLPEEEKALSKGP